MRFLTTAILCCATTFSFAASVIKQDIDDADQMQTFYNPDRGFYTPQVIHFKTTAEEYKPYGNRFIHLRADISEFSSNSRWGDSINYNHGTTQDLTEGFLDSFRKYLDRVRAQNSTVIVRFSYDPWYNGSWKYQSGFEMEPGQEWILRHIRQLAEVYDEYDDVITAVELGMYGPYGENHTSKISGSKNAGEALRELIRHTKSIDLVARTAAVVAQAFEFSTQGDDRYAVTFRIDSPYFQAKADSSGADIYRVGLFNDGYLGTEYDYGTWGGSCDESICREEGVAWLEKYGANTSYGGEALTTANGYKKINTVEFLSYEGFRTHTSYLNIQWNNNLIAEWKNTTFTPRDPIDSGYSSAFKYIDDHLGYRYVLKEAYLIDSLGPKSDLPIRLKIQNVGFGNMIKSRPVTIVLRKIEGDSYGTPIELRQSGSFDPQTIRSRTVKLKSPFDEKGNIADYGNIQAETAFDGMNEVRLEAKLPDSLSESDYAVFLRISQYGNWPADSNYSTVRFANDSAYFDKLIGSNYIGKFTLSAKAPTFTAIPEFPRKLAGIQIFFSEKTLTVQNADRIEIFDLTGHRILARKLSTNTETISLEKFPRGKFIARAFHGQKSKIEILNSR